jgi:PIN domain nuclease of toxin-antitoxin system
MPGYLIDTHVFVWLLTAPDRLGPKITARLADTGSEVFVSAVSALELADKFSKGRRTGIDPLIADGSFGAAAEKSGLVELPLSVAHAEAVRSLPIAHRDPFDRALIAQAMVENLVLVSHDAAFARYSGLNLLKI